MVGTIVVTAAYSNTTRLGNAYGVCVIFVTFITTCMVSLVALIIWKINFVVVIFFFLVFALLDGIYLSSALTKIPTGAWFTLLLAALLSTIFILWRFGKEQQWTAESLDTHDLPSLLIPATSTSPERLAPSFGSRTVSRVNGVGIFFDKVGTQVPIVFSQFVRKFSARPEIIVFFHMRPLSEPNIPEAERYVVRRTSMPGCYRLTIRHGYTDNVVSPDLGRLIIEQLVLFITRDVAVTPSETASSVEHSPEVQAELAILTKAADEQMVYVMGKEQMSIKKGTDMARRALLWAFLWIRDNSRTKMADMNIPHDQLVEVGFVKDI